MRIQQEVQRLREEQANHKPDDSNHEALSKAERMQQLREQYQQRHRERQGRYVDDDMDDDLSGREVDRYGHERPSPSPRVSINTSI